MSNTNAQLTYPVGLITYQEVILQNNKNITKTGHAYWTLSPDDYSSRFVYMNDVHAGGDDGTYNVYNSTGVRPVISLKPGTEYVSGNGSMADPYVVE